MKKGAPQFLLQNNVGLSTNYGLFNALHLIKMNLLLRHIGIPSSEEHGSVLHYPKNIYQLGLWHAY
jgi:hypothetical protein